MRVIWRRLGVAAAVRAAGILTPLAVGAAGVAGAVHQVYPIPPAGAANPHPARRPGHDPAKPTAVVVLGREGTNAADTLAPYEVLAVSEAFNLYTVADRRTPVPLTGGLDLMSDLSFAELDNLLATPPEVIVVPQIKGEDGPDGVVVSWLRTQHARGAPLLVRVCVGAGHLAQAGVLHGRPATSHWLGLIGRRAASRGSSDATTSATSTTGT